MAKYSEWALNVQPVPNKGVELTASSVRSYVAPASSRGSGLAFGARGAGKNPKQSLKVSLTRKGSLAVMQAATLEAALIAHAPDAVLFVDCTGVIRLWNRGAETLFGYSAAEAVGHTLDLIVPEPMRAAHWAGFYRAVQQGRFTKDTVLQTSRALTKEGRLIAVELSAAIIWSTSGQVWGIMAIGRDVTERCAQEQAQQERLARLERQGG